MATCPCAFAHAALCVRASLQALLTLIVFEPTFLPVMGMISHEAWQQYNWLLDQDDSAEDAAVEGFFALMPWKSSNSSGDAAEPKASEKRQQAVEMLCGEGPSSLPGAVQQRIHPKFLKRLATSNAVITHKFFWTETAFQLVRARSGLYCLVVLWLYSRALCACACT